MMLLQRIRFPHDPATAALYARPEGNWTMEDGTVHINPGGELDLDSFFNSCALGLSGWPVTVGRITIELDLNGEARIELVSRDRTGQERILAKTEHVGSLPLTLSFNALEQDGCRVFARVHAGSDGTIVSSGRVTCAKPESVENISLTIVTCTYLRESEVLTNVRAICADEELATSVRTVVADNGGTLRPEDLPEGVKLSPGPNLGGAGGFSRGMLEAVREGATHILLMDDDVHLDPESLLRCLVRLRLGPVQTALAGVLLDVERPTLVLEAGALMSEGSPLLVHPGLTGTDLASPEGLDRLLNSRALDYGGFWLFAFPASVVQETGALQAFFLKGDDVEFGLRLARASIHPTLLFGAGVRHPGFTNSFSLPKRYYWVRNMLAVECLHGIRDGRTVAASLVREAMAELRRLRYAHLEALVLGLEDFLRGPRYLESVDNASLFRDLQCRERTLTPKIITPPASSLKLEPKPRSPWLSLFGHLTLFSPPPALRPETVNGPEVPWYPAQHTLVDNGETILMYRLQRGQGLCLAMRTAVALVRLRLSFSSLRATWRERAKELASAIAWEQRERAALNHKFD